MSRRRVSPVLGAVLLVALARALVALSRLDELVDFELDSGSFGWALWNGMPLDPAALPVIQHQRGSVVVGLLCAAATGLLGPSYAVLKLVAVAVSCASAALFAAVLQRHAGAAAAWTGAVLYALLPPSFQVVDVLAIGSHGEILPFLFGALLAALALGRTPPAAARRVAVFGALCGAGLFMGLQFLVAVPPLLALWWLGDRDARRPLVLCALVLIPLGALGLPLLRGGPLGLAPWWALALAGGLLLAGAPRWRVLAFPGAFLLAAAPIPFASRSLALLGRPLGGHFLGPESEPAAKLLDTLLYSLRRSWLFEEHGGAALSWLYAGGLALGLGFTVRRAQRGDRLAILLLAYPALWLASYALSDLELDLVATASGLGSRYTMPLLPCLAAWVALGVAELARAGRPGLAALLAVPSGAAGLLGFLALVDPPAGLALPPRKGTEIGLFRGHPAHAAAGDPAVLWEWAERLDPDWSSLRPLTWEGFGSAVLPERRRYTEKTLLADAARVRGAPERLQPCLWAELGLRAARALGLRPHLPALERRLAPGELAWLLRGAGKGWLVPTLYERQGLVRAERERLETLHLGPGGVRDALAAWRPPEPPQVYRILAALPARLASPAAEGAGFWIGFRASPYQTPVLQLAAGAVELPPALRERFFRSAGLGYRTQFRENGWSPPPPGTLRVEAALPEGVRGSFRAGLELPPDSAFD